MYPRTELPKNWNSASQAKINTANSSLFGHRPQYSINSSIAPLRAAGSFGGIPANSAAAGLSSPALASAASGPIVKVGSGMNRQTMTLLAPDQSFHCRVL